MSDGVMQVCTVKQEVSELLSYNVPSATWFTLKSCDPCLSTIQQQLWLLSGLVMYPKSCSLKLQLYRWHLNNSDNTTAADHFRELLKEFPDDTVLIEHLTTLIGLIATGSNDLEVQVLKTLTEAEQQDIYLAVATSQHDKLTCTATVLQMMRAYPSSIAQHAISAATVLIKEEQLQGLSTAINPLRKMLILDLMPLILSKGAEFLDTLTETVVKLFIDLIAHYYIECVNVTNPAVKEEYKISDPWNDLRNTLIKFAELHKWQLIPHYAEFDGSLSVVLKNIEEFVADEPSGSGVFYCLLFTMFEHAFKCVKFIDMYSLILVKSNDKPSKNQTSEQSTDHGDVPVGDGPSRKRRRTLSITESCSNVINSFKIATTCMRFLRNNMINQFEGVCSELDPTSWRWYSLFLSDVAVFNDDKHVASIQEKHYKTFSNDQLRILTQQALGSSEASAIFTSLWALLDNMPGTSDPSLHTSLDIVICNPDINQNFSFVVNTRSKLCLHICRTLVNMVKECLSKPKLSADILGLLLIIYQYDISKFRVELDLTINAMKGMKTGFKYKGLLEHITEVDILEELLYLIQQHETKVDIIDSKKRYSKDDTVALIISRVDQCLDNSEDNVMKFIVNHKEDIETMFTQYAFSGS